MGAEFCTGLGVSVPKQWPCLVEIFTCPPTPRLSFRPQWPCATPSSPTQHVVCAMVETPSSFLPSFLDRPMLRALVEALSFFVPEHPGLCPLIETPSSFLPGPPGAAGSDSGALSLALRPTPGWAP